MTAQQLKNSILQMAIQGKLVSQDPNDEPASVLLQKIRKEKEQMIKDGKIKKEKNPSFISRGDDGLFYEKVGNKEPVCIEDEVPFEIPDSWEWVRFNNLVYYIIGKTPPRKETEYWEPPKYSWVSIADMNADGTVTTTKEQVSQLAFDYTFKGNLSPAGTLLMSFKLTVGKVSILKIPAFHNEAIISIYPIVDEDNTLRDYLFYTMPLLSQLGETKSAIKGNTLNSKSLDALLVPVPPLNEQKRIIKLIKKILPSIEKYNNTEIDLSILEKEFPIRLKKSILQMAVQGKLVSQDPNDEPASILIERIYDEKKQLIKDGKIKREKHESVIYRRDGSYYEKVDGKEHCIDKEILFEIPNTWEWVRLKSIAILENGDRSSKYPVEENYVQDGIPFFGAKDMVDGVMSYEKVRYITKEKFEELGNGKLKNNDFVCLLRGNVGKCALFQSSEKHMTGFICAQMVIIRSVLEHLVGYLRVFLSSPYYLKCVEKMSTGTAVRQLPAKELGNILVPLPPIEEQQRIINKSNTSLKILDGMNNLQIL